MKEISPIAFIINNINERTIKCVLFILREYRTIKVNNTVNKIA